MLYSLLFWFAAFGSFAGSNCGEFSYSDNCNWHKQCPTCGGKAQSPINLKTKWLDTCTVSPLIYYNFDVKLKLTMVNEGHTLVQYYTSKTGKLPIIEINGERFILRSGRIVFGTIITPGSEHTINNVRLDGEFIMLFRNIKYCPEVAGNYPDGHLRLIRLAKLVDDPNHPHLHKFWDAQISSLSTVLGFNSSITVSGERTMRESLGLLPLRHGKRMQAYIYSGSDTYPPCCPCLNVVFNEPLYINHPKVTDVLLMRNDCGHPMCNNYRCIQDLNKRKVTGVS